MILRGRLFGFVLCSLVAAAAARAGDDAHERPVGTRAPLEIPHTAELDLALLAKKRNRRPNNIENHQFLDLVDGLEPVVWPKNTDMRSRIVTQRLRNTPLVGFRRITAHLPDNVTILAKAEWTNPGGSVKDRAASSIIRSAERSGALYPGKVILDSTSGNTGIAYALIGASKGYRVKLFLPANVSPERIAIEPLASSTMRTVTLLSPSASRTKYRPERLKSFQSTRRGSSPGR